MRYIFIAQNQGEFPVRVMCRVLRVSQSGYYAWRKRPPSARQVADDHLSHQIRQIFREGRGVYGSPRVHATLHQDGIRCGRKRVARLMRRAGLRVCGKPRHVRTTDSQHSHPIAPNVLARNFTAGRPNEKWVADITGVWTQHGWLYLAGIVDCYSRLLVGWAMSPLRDEALVTAALQMALGRRQISANLIHHSDRGSQYTSSTYHALLADHGITLSMSRKGNCWDNALMESVWGTLKAECVERHQFATHRQAQTILFEYIEVFYNRQRLHSALGYHSPADFEQLAVASDSSPTP
jgi:putative transposase